MKTFHITYYKRRGLEANTSPLLGGITISAENIIEALLQYRLQRCAQENEELPPVSEIKYIIEL